jgi:hypothetical protein
LGVMRLPGRDVPVATKSGGFGGPQALLHTVDALLSGGGPSRR